ncbi:Gfo/Idh/MocA family oxidoreductase [Halorubrum distributum]|uniref:Gfo/Idh/MocA family oxidoreductase n=1 Tax=Halorubrum distributum TaxID=29283 RepID=UPI0029533CC6|nr:Gfo/Idh/MocA family oxidoreductase [Halorubrum distributum]MDV7348162.1 Gfo/Idh/MocA family oxidoreductase [Halorubrum distributum]
MPNTNENILKVGVIGVGSMGQHHARIYDGLPTAELVGVFDADTDRAEAIADKYNTAVMEIDELLETTTAVSVAVPTQYHFDIVKKCFDHGVSPLIEKPVVENVELAEELRHLAQNSDVTVQVGHVERFNPAVQVAQNIVKDKNILAVSAERLGPPPNRAINDSAVIDLMIHDIDILLSLIDNEFLSVMSGGIRCNKYGTAIIDFEGEAVATLTASQLTQQKVRSLKITTEEFVVEVDYIDQTVEIHRQSTPSYVEKGEGMRYRDEHVVEHPTVPSAEPLQSELESFVEVVTTGSEPEVTLDDGIQALTLAEEVEKKSR